MALATRERELHRSRASRFTGLGAPAVLCLMLIGWAGGGCAAIPLATLGTVAGISTSALSTGREIFTLGKLDTAEMAGYPEAVVAARRAAAELYLRPKGAEKLKDWTAELLFADEKGAKVEVDVERRTEMLVRIRIDVGLFGSEVTARLFLARLRLYLPPVKSPQPQIPASTEPAPA
jgi:hypothetical protein